LRGPSKGLIGGKEAAGITMSQDLASLASSLFHFYGGHFRCLQLRRNDSIPANLAEQPGRAEQGRWIEQSGCLVLVGIHRQQAGKRASLQMMHI
jgi:hypothetical protein